jgi:Holliday junction DNA helicase RuvB
MQFVILWLVLAIGCYLFAIKVIDGGGQGKSLFMDDNMFGEAVSPNIEAKKSDKPMEVVIKKEDLDLSNIKFNENKVSKNQWRPTEWNEYISQENVKGEMQDNVSGCLRLGETYPHTIVNGSAGHGKTALIELLAGQLNVPFVCCIGNDLNDRQVMIDKIAEAQGGILFIDEIHTLNNKIGNWLLPVIEQFKIQGKDIEEFTMIGATTEKGELIKRLKPFVDRCEPLTLEHYNSEDITKIITQFHKNVYGEHEISAEVLNRISNNSRLTPRNALRLLKLFIRVGSIDKVLERQHIVLDGITKTDIKLLEYLNKCEKPVGLEALSLYLGTSKNNYLYETEGFLIQKGFLLRQPRGRTISEEGKKLLEKLKVGV